MMGPTGLFRRAAQSGELVEFRMKGQDWTHAGRVSRVYDDSCELELLSPHGLAMGACAVRYWGVADASVGTDHLIRLKEMECCVKRLLGVSRWLPREEIPEGLRKDPLVRYVELAKSTGEVLGLNLAGGEELNCIVFATDAEAVRVAVLDSGGNVEEPLKLKWTDVHAVGWRGPDERLLTHLRGTCGESGDTASERRDRGGSYNRQSGEDIQGCLAVSLASGGLCVLENLLCDDIVGVVIALDAHTSTVHALSGIGACNGVVSMRLDRVTRVVLASELLRDALLFRDECAELLGLEWDDCGHVTELGGRSQETTDCIPQELGRALKSGQVVSILTSDDWDLATGFVSRLKGDWVELACLNKCFHPGGAAEIHVPSIRLLWRDGFKQRESCLAVRDSEANERCEPSGRSRVPICKGQSAPDLMWPSDVLRRAASHGDLVQVRLRGQESTLAGRVSRICNDSCELESITPQGLRAGLCAMRYAAVAEVRVGTDHIITLGEMERHFQELFNVRRWLPRGETPEAPCTDPVVWHIERARSTGEVLGLDLAGGEELDCIVLATDPEAVHVAVFDRIGVTGEARDLEWACIHAACLQGPRERLRTYVHRALDSSGYAEEEEDTDIQSTEEIQRRLMKSLTERKVCTFENFLFKDVVGIVTDLHADALTIHALSEIGACNGIVSMRKDQLREVVLASEELVNMLLFRDECAELLGLEWADCGHDSELGRGSPETGCVNCELGRALEAKHVVSIWTAWHYYPITGFVSKFRGDYVELACPNRCFPGEGIAEVHVPSIRLLWRDGFEQRLSSLGMYQR